jgi:transketolase N-terminal domain/subunit
MLAIAAAVIGGTSLFGGRGSTYSVRPDGRAGHPVHRSPVIDLLNMSSVHPVHRSPVVVLLGAVTIDSVSRKHPEGGRPRLIRDGDQNCARYFDSAGHRRVIGPVLHTGGHLGPNLGVVELTLALHRVFDSPRDRVLFDTGHQAYVHKIVTGRQDGFDLLRQRGGLSGYPSQAESEHDLIENSHASTALSYADGLAKAFALRGEDRHVVAVVGDGALTGGMCWEALNNIAAAKNRKLVIVVNDNGRSYAPTIGGLADHLSTLRLNPGYEKVLDLVKDALGSHAGGRQAALRGAARGQEGHQGRGQPAGMFEDLGLKYVGPVDGHDIEAMESALRRAKGFGGPVIVHAVTRKGYGYRPAEEDEADCLHGPGAFDVETGKLLAAVGEVDPRLRRRAGQDRRRAPDVVGITAAMASRPASPRSPANSRAHLTTSASPSSTRSPRRPASRWAACTRSSRSTRPSSTAPSTRSCWTWRCTSCR